MIDSEFRAVLHDRLGPALDELVAPDLLSAVRARQVRHKRSVRAGLAVASAASVAAIVTAAAFWPHGDSASPSGPAPAATPAAAVSTSAPVSAVPSPSTAVVDMSGVAPLVTSGECAGLSVAAYTPPSGPGRPLVAVTTTGTVLTLDSDFLLNLVAKGPCVDRLSYVPRTSAIQGGYGTDLPFHFRDGLGTVHGRSGRANRTALVQLFLDCKGLVCSSSGTPIATVTIHERGNAPGAASLPFAPTPSAIPLPSGQVVVVPSVVGLSYDSATQLLSDQGFIANRGSPGTVDNRLVTGQDPPAGSLVLRGDPVSVFASGPAPMPPRQRAPSAEAGQASAAVQSLAPGPASMPAVVGLSLDQAETLLRKSGITYEVVYALRPAPSHTITYQNPKAGVAVFSSTKVQLTVSLGPVPSSTATSPQ